MTNDEVISYFGNLSRAAMALNVTIPNITKWKTKGYIPYLQQYRIAEITEGALLPDAEDPKVVYQRKMDTLR